jgi:HEAT repeat protein
MRSFLVALGLGAIISTFAGCTRSTPAKPDGDSAPPRPAAKLQEPVAATTVPLGADEDGKAIDGASLDAIKAALADPDPAVRRAAVQKLAKVHWKFPEPVGGILTQALVDADAETRLEAICVAARDPLRAADISQRLHDQDRRVRLAAARALVALGKPNTDAHSILAEALADRQCGERPAILELLRSKIPAARAALPVLIAMSLDGADPLRIDAIGMLARFGTAQESLDALLLTAHAAEPKARAAALSTIGRLAPASAKVQVALVKALADAQVEVALAASEAVGRDGIPLLIERLRHGDDRLRDAAARALGRLGPEAWAAVAELTRLAQGDPAQRVRQSAQAAIKAIVPKV